MNKLMNNKIKMCIIKVIYDVKGDTIIPRHDFKSMSQGDTIIPRHAKIETNMLFVCSNTYLFVKII